MFVQRWLYSTNAKDIAILYFIFAIFCGMAGTAMSVIIRMELTAPGSQYLHGNNQLFNVLVAGHAILMIFFLVMPALIGGFGKEYNNSININNDFNKNISLQMFTINNKYFSIDKIKEKQELDKKIISSHPATSDLSIEKSNDFNKKKLGSYIAGLIEGDGTIHVPLNIKNRPVISIVFNINDKPIAIYLINLLNIGKIYDKKGNYIIWQINKIIDVYKLLDLTNKYYRTPKYYEMLRLIKWYEEYIIKNNGQLLNNNLIKLEYPDLDKSDLNLNYWLAGFTDANGNFYIQLLKNRIKLKFGLEIRKIFHKNESYYKNLLNNQNIDLNMSYFSIITKISNMFLTNLYSKNREIELKKGNIKIYSSYMIYVYNIKQYENVKLYFNKYPIISSKYLNYKDWEKLVDLVLKYNTFTHPDIYKLAKILLTNFNKLRNTYSWKHLKNNLFK